MGKKDDIRHLWREGFKDSDEYLDMYFDRIYRDDDALTITDEASSRLASALLMQHYSFMLQGSEVDSCYIAGCVTRRSCRGRGYMSQLLQQAILKAFGDGATLCTLIPAHDWLYFFFDRFGFSTVFFSDTQRFTSLHPFNVAETYSIIDDHYCDAVYNAFRDFRIARGDGILQSRRQFINVLDDLTMRPGGTFVAIAGKDTPVAAMAWAVCDANVVQVNEVLGVDNDACQAALRQLRISFPDMPFRYLAPADSPGHRHLHARAMARIVNVEKALAAVARANPKWKATIRISDPIISKNNATFIVGNATCEVRSFDSGSADSHPDFDVDIDTFNRILFSSPETGAILNFPSRRAHLSLLPH